MILLPYPNKLSGPRVFLAIFIISFLSPLPSALLTGCSRREPQPVSILTTEPEAILWTNIYNAQTSGPPVHCRYIRPEEFRRRTVRSAPDLLLDRSHGTPPPAISADPVPLPAPPGIYPGITAKLAEPGGESDADQKEMLSVPLAFDLPVIVYETGDEEAEKAAPLFSLEELQALGSAYNRRNNQRYTRLGFVPAWQNHFLSSAPFLFNVDFQAAPNRTETQLTWRENQLTVLVEELKQIIQATNGSYDAAEDFRKQYLYDPPEKLLDHGRIRLFQTTLSRYYALPEEYRQTLSFGYPSRREIVPVEPSGLFITAYSSPRKNPVLADFYSWLTSPEGQKTILSEKEAKGLSRFGLAGGLSSLPSVNTSAFPERYPALLSRTLPDHALGFPKVLPSHWSRLEEAVYLPWLRTALEHSREEAGDLETRIQNWTRRTLSN